MFSSSHFSFLSIRPPLLSTLFPYTTLFRSVLHARGVVTDDIEHVPGGKTFFWAGRYERDVNVRHTDRKSTRLNSSHLVISYAVFCLKKKKNTVEASH